MAIKTIITCDMCGEQKKETNHWWIAWTHATEFSVSPWHAGKQTELAMSRHLCSRNCLQKLFEGWMEKAA